LAGSSKSAAAVLFMKAPQVCVYVPVLDLDLDLARSRVPYLYDSRHAV
jgi:hypothetical protein